MGSRAHWRCVEREKNQAGVSLSVDKKQMGHASVWLLKLKVEVLFCVRLISIVSGPCFALFDVMGSARASWFELMLIVYA